MIKWYVFILTSILITSMKLYDLRIFLKIKQLNERILLNVLKFVSKMFLMR